MRSRDHELKKDALHSPLYNIVLDTSMIISTSYSIWPAVIIVRKHVSFRWLSIQFYSVVNAIETFFNEWLIAGADIGGWLGLLVTPHPPPFPFYTHFYFSLISCDNWLYLRDVLYISVQVIVNIILMLLYSLSMNWTLNVLKNVVFWVFLWRVRHFVPWDSVELFSKMQEMLCPGV